MKKKAPYLLSIVVIAVYMVFAYGSGEDDNIELNADVSFTGTQFIITNNDIFDYENCRIELNSKYLLKNVDMDAGDTYTVGIMRFADKDGNRFTLNQKPQKLTISCKVEGEKYGFLYAEWN